MKMPELPETPRGPYWDYCEDDLTAYALAYGALVREECAKLAAAIGNGWIRGKERDLSAPEVAHLIADALRADE